MLHGKCRRTVFTHELLMLIKILFLNFNLSQTPQFRFSSTIFQRLQSPLTEQIKPARCLFNSARSMCCTSRLSLFLFLKNFSSNFTSCFLFCVLVFKSFHIILDWSTWSRNLFLLMFLTFNTCKSLRFLKKVKYCQLNENHLVVAHIKKKVLSGTWLDVSFSLHMTKAIRATWLAVGFLDLLVNQIYFALFSILGTSQ